MTPALPTPQLWIIAGPNGSGKSSAYSMLAVESPKDTVWIINPDLLAKRISDHESLQLNPEANLKAVRRIEAWLYASIEAYQTIGVETVLSGDKYRRLVTEAKAKGFQVNFIYVYLETVELNIQRVRLRVKRCGHDVPEAKIRERRIRSFEQLSWFFGAADEAYVYDNSGARPQLVASKTSNEFSISSETIPEVWQAILRNYPEFEEVLSTSIDDI